MCAATNVTGKRGVSCCQEALADARFAPRAPRKQLLMLHQAAEYLIGAVFVAQGLQSPTPVVPSVLGGLVIMNTACAKGTISAFQVFGKRMHQLLDAMMIVVIVVAAIQPVFSIDIGTRLLMAVVAFVLGFIWVKSDFAGSVLGVHAARGAGTQPPPAEPGGGTAENIVRVAGRLAGKGANIYRLRKAHQKR